MNPTLQAQILMLCKYQAWRTDEDNRRNEYDETRETRSKLRTDPSEKTAGDTTA